MLDTRGEIRTAQILRSQEHQPTQETKVGFQARLLLGGSALDVNQQITQTTVEQLSEQFSNATERNNSTYALLSNASTDERNNYWEQRSTTEHLQDHQAKLNKWLDEMESTINHQGNQNIRTILGHLTLGDSDVNMSTLSRVEFEKIYSRYFNDASLTRIQFPNGNQQLVPSNVIRFVNDITQNYRRTVTAADGTTQTIIDYNALRTDLIAIQWLSNTFGAQSAAIITQLIDAEVKVLDPEKRKELAEQTLQKPDGQERPQGDQLEESTKTQLQFVQNGSRYVNVTEPLQHTDTPPVADDHHDDTTHPPHDDTSPSEPSTEPSTEPPPAEPEPHPEVPVPAIVIDPFEQPVYARLPKKERWERLPAATRASMEWFCNNLRARLKLAHPQQITDNGVTKLSFLDPKTQAIKIETTNADRIENEWFGTSGFLTWALSHKVPLAFYINTDSRGEGSHAQTLLKLDVSNGKLQAVFYDPKGTGEHREDLIQKPFDQFIIEKVNTGEFTSTATTVDGRPYYTFKLRTGEDLTNNDLINHWLNAISPPNRKIIATAEAINQLVTNTFDLTLQDDRDLPDKVKKGKLQVGQFDGKNCVPISFFHAVMRYLAKPGNVEDKNLLAQQFKEDFGVELLTREQILA